MAELLITEQEMFLQELDALRETSEMRQERMLQRARELKAKREEERRKFAQEQLEKKWREDCDDLRQLESQDLTKKVQVERMNQLKQQEEKRAKELEGYFVFLVV